MNEKTEEVLGNEVTVNGSADLEDSLDEKRLEKFFQSAQESRRRMNQEIQNSRLQRERICGEVGSDELSQWKEEHHQLEFMSRTGTTEQPDDENPKSS